MSFISLTGVKSIKQSLVTTTTASVLRHQPDKYNCNTFIWSTEPRSSSTNLEPSVESSAKQRKSKKKKKLVSDKICFRFNRLRSFVFKVQCDRRQLPVFRQFPADCQANASAPKEEHFSSSLFTLRFAQLIWQKDTNKRKEKKSDKSQFYTSDQP